MPPCFAQQFLLKAQCKCSTCLFLHCPPSILRCNISLFLRSLLTQRRMTIYVDLGIIVGGWALWIKNSTWIDTAIRIIGPYQEVTTIGYAELSLLMVCVVVAGKKQETGKKPVFNAVICASRQLSFLQPTIPSTLVAGSQSICTYLAHST